MTRRCASLGLLLVALAACAETPRSEGEATVENASAAAAPASPPAAVTAPVETPAIAAAPADAALPTVLVHKSPTCGCCTAWVEHMRQSGFTVQVNETDELEPIRQRLGVPLEKRSCHTAEVGPYFAEGHVPAEDIKRLLEQGSESRGLVLPGMPIGSPGMEVPDGRVERYTVERVDAQGATHPFATHGE